jgi:ATP-binding cassette subfamily B protein
VVEEGSHEALIQLEKGLYRRLFERQALELIKGLSEPDVRRAAHGASKRQSDDSEMLVGE